MPRNQPELPFEGVPSPPDERGNQVLPARPRAQGTRGTIAHGGPAHAGAAHAPEPPPDSPIAYLLVRSPRARRYILRLRPDGVVRVTIPARGSKREALEVIERHRPWIERQWRLRMADRRAHETWTDGTRILFRGDHVTLSLRADGSDSIVHFAGEAVRVPANSRVRDAVERRLRDLAERELEPRLRSFAATHGLPVKQVTIRNQRTRWGSCSRRGSISLNWRLVQMPPSVSDYIMLHELMHLRQANHSRRFWREVEAVCPEYREAETWLRRTGKSLW